MKKVYFGNHEEHVYYGEFCEKKGELKITGKSPEIIRPSYLALGLGNLYAVSEFENAEGFVASIDLANNKITSLQKTNGELPCHVCVVNNSLFVSNYMTGSLAMFYLNGENGEIEPLNALVDHKNIFKHSLKEGMIADRQECAHVHCARLYGKDNSLAVCDLGNDKVVFYRLESGGIILPNEKAYDLPAGTGPRHVEFNGDVIYINGELSNKVLVYKDNLRIQEISTLPNDFHGESTSGAIKISPDKNYLVCSNRGHDSLAYYKILDDGTLEILDYVKVGKCPRDFAFSPNGKWILCGSQTENFVKILKVEGDKIIDTGRNIETPLPVCILFE